MEGWMRAVARINGCGDEWCGGASWATTEPTLRGPSRPPRTNTSRSAASSCHSGPRISDTASAGPRCQLDLL